MKPARLPALRSSTNLLPAVAAFDSSPLMFNRSQLTPAVLPVKSLTLTRYRPPPLQMLVPVMVNVPTLVPLGDSVAPLPISTTPLPTATVPLPASVA